MTWLDKLSQRQMTGLVILFGLALYIPFAGTYGLWDPWETHYSEVARQMTVRHDFISLWWPGSPRDAEVFWSKPVLSFWLMSLSMMIFGIGGRGGPPDEMAIGSRAEWAVRLPFCLMGVVGILGVYWVVQRFVSRRAAIFSAVVLATSPMYSLVARQAMTDMAFVGPMTLALALGAFALFDDEDQVLPRRGRGLWSWPDHPLFYAVLGLFVLTTVPQLIVNSIQLRVEIPWRDGTLKMYGAVAMIPYDLAFAAFVWLSARSRFKAPLYLYGAAILCALAVLAKGLAGLGLPLIVFLTYLLFTWNWRRLRRAQLLFGVVVSIVALVVVAVPWHHAMLIRHGTAFWNELFGDNHWRRLVLGRHGDRGTFEYFLRELGYGVWPWIALAPAALGWAVMRRADARSGAAPGPAAVAAASVRAATDPAIRVQGIIWLGAIWFVACYGVVSLSMTKFHHYVLPAIPGLAICVGCFMDDLLSRDGRRRAALAAAVGIPLLALISVDLTDGKSAAQRFLWLFSYDYIHSPRGRPWPESLDFSTALIVFSILFGVTSLALSSRRFRRWAAVALCASAVVVTYYLLDHFMPSVAPFWSQKNVIATYYKDRRSPDEKLIAFQLYWRGETFYTKNAIYSGPMEERTIFDGDGADEKMKAYFEAHRGRRLYFIFEKGQRGRLQGLLPSGARATFQVVDDANNKFTLARADI